MKIYKDDFETEEKLLEEIARQEKLYFDWIEGGNKGPWPKYTPMVEQILTDRVHGIDYEYIPFTIEELKQKEMANPSEKYIEFRQMEYPDYQEQLDMQYHDKINGTTTWEDLIKSIKDKYPKPE